MLKIENSYISGLEPAIRGMRNPMNSWDKSDSSYKMLDNTEHPYPIIFKIGEEDLKLAKKLVSSGTDHRKFMRMIVAYMDITAPLYWWKEFDTYKVGTVANSCSTMHKLTDKPFELHDFSWEHLSGEYLENLEKTIELLNYAREAYKHCKDTSKKTYWWQMIQLLPTSYEQKRTVMLSYEVLANIYPARLQHKLDEWHTFCNYIRENLPYSELFTQYEENK